MKTVERMDCGPEATSEATETTDSMRSPVAVAKRAIQKPGRSKQDYGTPWEFIDAVAARFGPIAFDLAAHAANCKHADYYNVEDDSLSKDWTKLRGNLWLNPEFGDIAPWAAKSSREASHDRRVFMLTPASIGSNWFAEHVHGKALVLGLSPRMMFEGATDPYPRDLMLSIYGEFPGFGTWRWR